MKLISNLLQSWSDSGIRFWYAHDGSTDQKSITLFFAYVTFIIAVVGNIALYFNPELLSANLTSISFWAIAFVFYRLRKLDSLKIDLDDREIEINGSDKDEKDTN